MSGDCRHRLGVGWGRRLCLAIGLWIGLIGAFGASATPAWATCANQVYDEALPVSSSSPADGASSTETSSGIPWQIVTLHGASLYVRVATQPTLGNDGTLSTLNQADDFALVESNTYGYYTGVSNAGWPDHPGQYYWQVFGSALVSSNGVLTCHAYASPVYTITVAAPQPPPQQQPPQQPPPTTPVTNDDSLRATLNSFGPKIVNDENAVKRGLAGYPKGKVRPLTRALRHEVGDLNALKSQLFYESPSSPAGAQAKTDIIQGLGLIASGYSALRNDVLAAHGGPVPAAKVNAAVNNVKNGRKKLQAGLKLLGTQPNPNPTPTPTPTPTACSPLTSSGNCYEPGEYCSNADHGISGVAGDGEPITCEYNNGWRWEPT
jgi:hypothetical protein